MKLILAIKKPPYIYKGTDILQDGGYKNFYYNTPMLNCLYNCSYCFLQGMYPSANIVVFVNQIDMQDAVKSEIVKREYKDQPLMLSISYNTDSSPNLKVKPVRLISPTNELDGRSVSVITKRLYKMSF